MPPERWQKVERLYHAALELAGTERGVFLTQACGPDEELRREVESLLAAHDRAGSFIAGNAVKDNASRIALPSFVEQPAAKLPAPIERSINQYKLISAIGKGGMGEVWLAEDTRLHRKVALKLLPAEFTSDAGRVRRFEQEAQAVSALNHPNIVTLFDLGHAGDDYFMATEFIDGQTLRERLRDNARLPVAEAIEIALQICHALAAAHEAGIIHRDIKPENVMLRRDGYVKVLDFGLAKVLEGDELKHDTGQSSLTDPGMILGTVSYMSPEQARGQRVDARGDIFSLGIVLYEMLAGRLPFVGETVSDVMADILKTDPLPINAAPVDVPGELQRVVMRALSKDRDARYQKIEDLAEELRQFAEEHQFKARLAHSGGTAAEAATSRRAFPRKRVAAGLALLLALLSGLLFWQLKRAQPSAPAASAPVKSLAVLPFKLIGGLPADEYIGLGMADALIGKLSGVRRLSVRPTNTVLKYQRGDADAVDAGQTLKVDAVLTGSVQKAGDKVRVTVQLINTPKAGEAAQALWSDSFNATTSDLFDLQDKLSAQVVQTLALRLSGDEQQRLAKRHTESARAYELYLKGRAFWRIQRADPRAIACYEQAIALDANFALAYSGLADTYSFQANDASYGRRTEFYEKAKAAALKAVALDEQLAEAHTSLGWIKRTYEWDWAGSEWEFQRAIALDPNYATAHQWYSQLLTTLGRTDEALRVLERARELDPDSYPVQSMWALTLRYAGRFDESIAAYQQVYARFPYERPVLILIADLYFLKGQYEEARQGWQANADFFNPGQHRMRLARLGARTGDRSFAPAVAAGALKEAKTRARRYLDAAHTYVALGDHDAAIAALEKAHATRDDRLVWLKVEPLLKDLHPDPRFQDLLRRMGL